MDRQQIINQIRADMDYIVETVREGDTVDTYARAIQLVDLILPQDKAPKMERISEIKESIKNYQEDGCWASEGRQIKGIDCSIKSCLDCLVEHAIISQLAADNSPNSSPPRRMCGRRSWHCFVITIATGIPIKDAVTTTTVRPVLL